MFLNLSVKFSYSLFLNAYLLQKLLKITIKTISHYVRNLRGRKEKEKMFQRRRIKEQIEELNRKLEATKINEYVELMGNTKKLLWKNFISGISRGIGIAIGFTILGAIVLIILQKIVLLNIPVIGKYLKDILDIIETTSYLEK